MRTDSKTRTPSVTQEVHTPMKIQSSSVKRSLARQNLRLARTKWGPGLSHTIEHALRHFSERFSLSVAAGDLLLIDEKWYVAHSGLLRLATQRHCAGIDVVALPQLCDPPSSRWAFKATVYKSPGCKGFVGFGDADPTNVSMMVRGAEMRVAETRAVNRALRKAYGIGICSVEEIGSLPARNQAEPNVRKLPPQPAKGSGEPRLRDQLCLLIRQHRLDASLVKQYAAEFCGTDDLRQTSREQIQSFITHLTELATKDREGLLCKLNSFGQKPEAGAA
jgi:hypothetical protein